MPKKGGGLVQGACSVYVEAPQFQQRLDGALSIFYSIFDLVFALSVGGLGFLARLRKVTFHKRLLATRTFRTMSDNRG